MKNGFSLIEVLIAIAVAAVVLPAVVILLSFGSFTSQQGETYTKAYAIAQGEMETIYNSKKSNWDSVAIGGPTCAAIPNEIFNKCITVSQINLEEKNVVIKISWFERGVPQDITIESWIAKI